MNNKKKYGEVFTPFHLAREMVSKIPENILKNPNTKILEPSAGHGVFIIALYEKLKQYHTSSHILTNMLYAVELNPSNATILKTIMPNVYQQSFLDYNPPFKFDIIIGNPPYQELKEGNKKSKQIWHLFVLHSTTMLNENGYLIQIHPSGWRDLSGNYRKIFDYIKERNLIYLSIHSYKDGNKYFNCATIFDWYIVQNTITNNNITTIRDIDGNIQEYNLNDLDFIPNGKYNEIQRLIDVNNPTQCFSTRNHDRKYHLTPDDINKYPHLYKIGINKGITKCYLKEKNKCPYSNIPKVMWSNGSSTYPIIDNGELGTICFSYAIIDEPDKLPLIQKVLNNTDFINLMKYTIVKQQSKFNYYFMKKIKKDFYMNYQ